MHAHGTVTTNLPPARVYELWRDLPSLPRFMTHLRAVEEQGDGRSHWVAEAPAGTSVEWDGALRDLTAGRGPDACIDAVGMEAHHGSLPLEVYDKTKQALRQETERPHALRQAITSCRNGGVVSIIGVYGGMVDEFLIGSLMNRSRTVRSGQCHVHRYMRPLLDHIQRGELDPTFVITHRGSIEDAPEMYETFKHKRDGCVKVMLSA